jgi:signal peptidase I
VAALTLLFGPFVGMLYLGKGKWALIYLVIGFLFAACCIAFLPALIVNPNATLFLWLFGLPLSIIGAIQGVVLARRRNVDDRLPWYSHWYVVFVFLLLPAISALSIRTFLFQPFNTPAVSMSPSLNRGDYFFVSKFAYDQKTPQRGDLVVFHVPQLGNDYVKRIIGLPGDRVQLRGSVVFINNRQIARRRIQDFVGFCPSSPCPAPQYEEGLPGGRAITVLDLWSDGPFDTTEVFKVPQDSYFVLGDNRDNSDDSRGSLGFIPRDQIVGEVAYKYIANGRLTWLPVN